MIIWNKCFKCAVYDFIWIVEKERWNEEAVAGERWKDQGEASRTERGAGERALAPNPAALRRLSAADERGESGLEAEGRPASTEQDGSRESEGAYS